MAPTIYFQEEKLIVQGYEMQIQGLTGEDKLSMAKDAFEKSCSKFPAGFHTGKEQDLVNRSYEQKLTSLDTALELKNTFIQYSIEPNSKDIEVRALVTGPASEAPRISISLLDTYKQHGFKLLSRQYQLIPIVMKYMQDTEYREALAVLLH